MFTKRQNEPHTPPRKPWAPMFQGGDGVLQTLCAGFDFLGVHHFTQYATVARTNEICPCSSIAEHPPCKRETSARNQARGSISSRGRTAMQPPLKRDEVGAAPTGSTIEVPVIGEIKSLLSSRVSCVGSSPTASIYYRHVAKRTRHRSSKSIIGGSIPPVVNMLDSFISRTRSLHLREGGAVPSLSTNSLIAKRTRRFSPKEVNVGSTPTEAYAVEADRSMHRATNAEIAGSIPAGGFYDSVAQPGLELKAVNFRVAGSNPARVSIVESYNGITCGCYPHDRGSKPCSTANSLTGKHCGRSSIVEHLVVVQSTSARYRPITPMESSLMVGHCLENSRACAYRVRFSSFPNMPVCANGKALPLKTEGMGVRLPRRVISACSPTGRRRHIQDMYSAGSNPATHTISVLSPTWQEAFVLGTKQSRFESESTDHCIPGLTGRITASKAVGCKFESCGVRHRVVVQRSRTPRCQRGDRGFESPQPCFLLCQSSYDIKDIRGIEAAAVY